MDIADLFGENGALLPLDEIPLRARRLISGIEVTVIESKGEVCGRVSKVKLMDRVRVLELIGKQAVCRASETRSPPRYIREAQKSQNPYIFCKILYF